MIRWVRPRPAFRNLCFENGLVTRAVREGLVFSPPLIISEPEVDELVSTLKLCLDTTWSELQEG